MLTPGRKRALVDKLRSDWNVSIRRACSALQVDRALYVYKSRRGSQADIRQRIKEIAETRMRYGYRRIHVLLRREGWLVNQHLLRLLAPEGWHETPAHRHQPSLRVWLKRVTTSMVSVGAML